MNDRILGYSVIAIIVLFLILPIGYLVWQASAPTTTRTIAFKNVSGLSFLSVQDPVSIQGVEVGTIRDIAIKGTTAFIHIESKDTLRLYEDYSITVVAKGVMGDRYLLITPGTPQKKQLPAETLLYGTVAVGPDDALSYVGKLRDAVHTLVTVSGQLRYGTAECKPLVVQLWDFTATIDSLMRTLLTSVGEIDTLLKNGLDSADRMFTGALALADTLNRILPDAANTARNALSNVDSIIANVESLISTADSLLLNANDPELLIWKKSTGKITENLTKLRKVFREIQSDSLELPVRLW